MGEEAALLIAGGVCEGREDPIQPAGLVICAGHHSTFENHLAQLPIQLNRGGINVE